MIRALDVQKPPAIAEITPDELADTMERVLAGELPGFVVSAAVPDAFNQSIDIATDMGLDGGINNTTMTFNYDTSVAGLAAARAEGRIPGPEEWEDFGITSLHADGEEGDEMLSISRALRGAYIINVLKRGPATQDDMPIELWDTLQVENTRLLLDGMVDTDNLSPVMTSLDIEAGDTVIFNPSNPHMGITTKAPRRAETTFYFRGR
ncbi:MAG TPA: hypothetical protein VF572_06875 [Candidatus Saccharimonadales bacterium]